MLNKTLDIVDKLINFIMVIFFILLILIGGYAFFDSYQIYNTTALDDKIITLKPATKEDNSIEALRQINSDVDGWITIFGTSIDYPILHSKDNLDYLNLDIQREYTSGGSIFIDYRNQRDFIDDYTIVYGHNMATGQMFSDIKKYEDSEYFNQHLYGVLYTMGKMYKLEVLALAKVNAYEDDVFNLITYANGRNLELVELIKSKAERMGVVGGVDKLILLSTCDSYGSNDRTVLLARLVESDAEEMQEIENMAKENVAAIQDGDAGARMGLPFRVGDLWWIILIIILLIVLWRVVVWYVRKKRAEKKAMREKKA